MARVKTKFCPACRTAKPATSFHARKASKDGLASQCKACRNEEMRRRYREWKAKN